MKIPAYIIKDLKLFMKSKSSVLLTFLVPMIIIFIFGSIFSTIGKQQGINPIRVLCVDNDKSDLSKNFLKELNSLSEITIIDSITVNNQRKLVSVETMNDLIKKGKIRIGLIVPENFETMALRGKNIELSVHYDPQFAIEHGILVGLIQKTIFSRFPQIMINSFYKLSEKSLGKQDNEIFKKSMQNTVRKFFPEADLDFDFKNLQTNNANNNVENNNSFNISDLIEIDSIPMVGEEVENQMFAQYVAGMAILFLLFSLNSVAGSLLEEKRKGTLKRILISPMKPIDIILGKMMFCILLGTAQLIVLFIFGYLVFNLNIFRDLLSLFLMIIVTAMASTSIGMFLATICKTESQANSLSTLIVLSMSALGGSMVPTFIMPASIQMIGRFTLNHWAMKGFTDIFWRQLPIRDIIPSALILLMIFFVFTLLSLFLYNKWKIQD